MRRARGFTLLELLVALAIVAVIGAIALTGLTRVIEQQATARERTDRTQKIQFAIRMIMQDLAQLNPRITRDDGGEVYVPSLVASPVQPFALELSRGGWANPAGFPRGTIMRVAYDWEDGELVRYHWPVMDRTLSTPPLRTVLLDRVVAIEVRFLDRRDEWQLDWPPVEMEGPPRLTARPKAMELTVELEDLGRIWRLMEIGG